ncbi:Bug family tripartite tricarboxylate transporter substrate binding protein [Brenneria tiliae]|uniref:Tripartite tricarboxylate transporter substrate binding protein n=1 Tax=Brenneria tiliae TaxID=2914984 RepID=A0ABT0MY26_9GAMM|nr:tripartite tricarboxylate transporter substrate-binding protein [Brenneria tiliae]MCL2894746.1 hypothetical protein [Brenneria tiliae]MCL2898423.1 hypothetical protein [Brenneria tiliae]MCL2903035.1 hypothetical protein [Brenneria tiliae]
MAALLLGTSAVAMAAAGSYPDKPITLIVPQSPGSVADIMARVLSKPLGDLLQQTIVVENRAGASGAIGAQAVARAAPDGYTILVGSISTNGGLLSAIDKSLPYHPINDFEPITQINDAPLVLIASPQTGLKSLADLAQRAKRQPGALTYASAGNSSGSRFVVELLRLEGKLDLRHIPYRAPAEAVRAVVAGEATIGAPSLPSAQSLVAAGRLNALAVTSNERSPLFPDVPTTAEQGFPSAVLYNWTGLFAPAGTPRAIIDKFGAAARQALTDAEVVKVIRESGANAIGQSPEAFRVFVESEVRKWHQAVEDSGI